MVGAAESAAWTSHEASWIATAVIPEKRARLEALLAGATRPKRREKFLNALLRPDSFDSAVLQEVERPEERLPLDLSAAGLDVHTHDAYVIGGGRTDGESVRWPDWSPLIYSGFSFIVSFEPGHLGYLELELWDVRCMMRPSGR